MKATLVMKFKLENGKSSTISITSPKEDLTGAEVTAAANEMVTKQAFMVGGSPLAALEQAFIRTVEETELP
ncbi:MAG: DUF2922 domain-containing protein [Selenomonas sp.]|uniref:DUF2922 domain-containing protein n=1 Tax=Selenomonas sp. TaxID=2053611 RepID=UPI0025CF13FF|nr:DUF2922 domain-containing protein [Selenomonas sp.]MCR5757753.1 DUF2922 domain-containing protein [Selenomonas sp.]